jgi:hypothetical protein
MMARPSMALVRRTCVAVAALVALGGMAGCNPGPPQGTWVGMFTFVEKGTIPFGNGSRRANVVTTYEGASNQVGGATTLVRATVDVSETYPNPNNGQCFIKSETYVGTITTTTSSNVSFPSRSTIAFNGGSGEGTAGSVTHTTVQAGPLGCRLVTVERVGFFNETGPWSYSGPSGVFSNGGYDGSARTQSARWLSPGFTTVSWQDVAVL